jgi:hypothetical protein
VIKKISSALVCVALLAACAARSDQVTAAYVSPVQYSTLDCDQLRTELTRVSARVNEVAGAQDRKHRNDQIATGVGIVLFWPALFFLMSDDNKAELSRLKGEYDALDANAVQKKCSIADEMHKTT